MGTQLRTNETKLETYTKLRAQECKSLDICDTGIICAYTEGVLFGLHSNEAIDCPFTKGSPNYDLWLVGYEHGVQQRTGRFTIAVNL